MKAQFQHANGISGEMTNTPAPDHKFRISCEYPLDQWNAEEVYSRETADFDTAEQLLTKLKSVTKHIDPQRHNKGHLQRHLRNSGL